jgi:hypothetical protein
MSTKKQELGWNDWDKICDPTGFIDIAPYSFDRVEKIKDPQDIQDTFDKYGVEQTVLLINREYLVRHDKYALEIAKLGKVTILRKPS